MRRQSLRRTARQLRAVGLALMAASAVSATLGSNTGRALASPFVQLAQVIATIAVPAPAVTPAAPPSPSPGPKMQRGGPLTFGITGSVSMGERQQTNVIGDASSGETATSNTSQTDNAGLMAQIERRTVSTTLEVGLPMALALHRADTGLVQAGYYTPKYGMVFGGQPLSLLGGVPLGQTQLGLALVLPLRGGDLTFFSGPAFGAYQEALRLEGIRARTLVRSTLIEAGIDQASASDGTTVGALMFGAAQSNGLLSHSLEAALESIHDPGTPAARAFSYQYTASYGTNGVTGSITARDVSDGFVEFGSGALLSDRLAAGSLRVTSGPNNFDLDESIESGGDGDAAVTSRRGTFTFTRSFSGGVQEVLSLTDEHRNGALGVDWDGGISEQLGFNVFNVGAALGAQFERSTLTYDTPIGLMTYTGELQRQFGPLNATAAYQSVRETGTSPGLQSLGSLAVTRNFGATALTFGLTRAHILTDLSDVSQMSPTVTLARRISPSVSLGLTYGEQATTDHTDPAANGRSRIFSIQIAAPFAIGSGLVQGRVDPRLPATITGTVVNDTGANQYSFASTLNNGVGNVVVVLDDQDVQRTDLSGHYQFNFVSPGTHELRLESSSLPRGVTADQPYASVTVMGGQRAQISFRVGTFGAIAGHIWGRDASGEKTALPGVSLQLDNTLYAHSDPLGGYSFGRLTAGTHTIVIQDSSLPANVFFAKSDETQKVVVQNGQITTIDFFANPLGSIAGVVTYDKGLAPLYNGGVDNAYVVANPGNYAAITNADGSFLLDNLPAGTYSLDLDPETLPDETANGNGPVSVTLGGNEHKEDVDFTIGKKTKTVVFSLKTTEAAQASMSLSEPVLPPLGAAQVVVDPGEDARAVAATILGKTYALTYDPQRKRWSGIIFVPRDAPAGHTSISAQVSGAKPGSDTTASADLSVDPSMQLATFKVTPAVFSVGQYVAVRARFLADVRPGDSIRWLDGQITKLGHPVSGRVYAFTVKISEHHMRGLLLTRQGQLPITLR